MAWRLLDGITFAHECVPTEGGYACVDPDPRSACHVYEVDAAGWRCVL